MNLCSPKSRQGIVNLLADFILNKISKEEKTILEVNDFVNFIVIKGKTTSKEILNLQEIIEEIKTNYSNIFSTGDTLSRVIDIIEYDAKISDCEEITHSFYNSENCSYSYSQLDNYKEDCIIKPIKTKNCFEDLLSVKSEFPHGFSLNCGRELYYFGKYITYNIPSNYPFTKLTLTLSNNQEKFVVFDDFIGLEDETLKSAILDCIPYNPSWVREKMKKVDWCSETTDPLSEYDFLKEKVKDFIII
jgi:hypothetical protein